MWPIDRGRAEKAGREGTIVELKVQGANTRSCQAQGGACATQCARDLVLAVQSRLRIFESGRSSSCCKCRLLPGKMFKRPPQTKAATPLRSSSRRQLLNVLQQLYPVLKWASPEIINELVPNGIKQGSAVNTNGVKVLLYTDPERGRPLWWEAGNDNGAWMNSKKTPANAEILPAIYALWLVPNLLPVLPTWPQVIEGALLGGSALMMPGLLPAPHTFIPNAPGWPPKGSLVAITGHPSDVPQVIARTELDMREIVDLRASGQKGKAATTLHAYRDGLWELGGKGPLPDKVVPVEESHADSDGEVAQHSNEDEAAAALVDGIDRIDVQRDDPTPSPVTTTDATPPPPSTTFGTSEIDAILYVALLSAIQSLATASTSSALPLSASAFYSSHVLPHRPSHWPPRPSRSKAGKKGRAKGTPGSHDGQTAQQNEDAESRTLNADLVVVPKSSAKKLTKWIKAMDKEGLLKVKETRGEATVVDVNASHPHVVSLTPFETCSEVDARAGASAAAAAATSTSTSGANEGTGGAAPVNDDPSSSQSSPPNTIIHVQTLYACNELSASFLIDTLPPSPFHTAVTLRKALLDYITTHCEAIKGNQSLVRPDGSIREALALKPISIRREEIFKTFMARCVVEYTRVSRLTRANASQLGHGEGGDGDVDQTTLSEGEFIGKLKKSPAASTAAATSSSPPLVKITLKRRQGNKIVSLITGLEGVGIDPKKWAAEVMRGLGTSTAVSALQGSTAKNPLSEVLVQGDQRKALLEKLSKSNGVDKKFVAVIEPK